VELARWISDYYLCPLYEAVSLMLPPGFSRRTLTFFTATTAATGSAALNLEQSQALSLIQQKGELELRQLEKLLGKKRAAAIAAQLLRKGLVTKSYELEPVRIKPRLERRIGLAIPVEEARREAARLADKGNSRQAALLDYLAGQDGQVSLAEARKNTGAAADAATALEKKGLVSIRLVEVRREPISYESIEVTGPLKPTADQKKALKAIGEALGRDDGAPAVFLLHGVTGSGKTEVYMQALARAVKLGRRAIVLVPEIALTPQTIERFAARFPGRVAVLHSKLSAGEQFDEWRRIQNGEFDVVIGPRGAIFAPQPDLGLIVIDEEHEWTYKQQDKSPRYHARRVALKLAELSGAAVVLGSATPDVESYYHAQKEDYRLLELPQRLTPYEGSPLPAVELVDLREELKGGNRSIFSLSLRQAMDKALAGGEQVILFFNRRGGATFVQCRDCGFVMRCRRCEVALSYHPDEEGLVCHQCNYRADVPPNCPRCASPRLKFLGLGTQKLAREAGFAFPLARLLRWDSDATRQKHSHQQILEMVAKGLDLPAVTLVGVVSADTALNLPDFRAGERTFQLLSQVTGRAGRGHKGGQAIIQSYLPEHYAIQAAANHDYKAFYEQEIGYRRQLNNPPFSRLARLVFSHPHDTQGQQEAARMKVLLVSEMDAQGVAGLTIIGPAPTFIHRRRGRFHWQLLLRGPELSAFLGQIAFPRGWAVDVDPVGLA
jgi:primosomal protein N' (replication factor Y)